MKVLLTGNEAAARAVVMARTQVIAAYPITPQTSIGEKLASAVAQGELKARYLKVESETSALAAAMGGSLAGARAFTATSSQGLALMHELLHWSSGARLPIVLANVNRSMAAPWSLGTDHNDTLSQRDTGWLQLYCETAQEVLDSILIAFRLAEASLLPIMVCLDGFLLSHYSEPVSLPEPEEVDAFLPGRKAKYRLDPGTPATYGGGVSSEVLFGLRRRMQADMEAVPALFRRICREFKARFGREYRALETFGPQRAETALVAVGSMAGTVKEFIQGEEWAGRVGLVKMRMFRPFPAREVRQALKGYERVVVIDRDLSPGAGGIFAQEIKAALYGSGDTPVASVIGGLGGVDVNPDGLGRLMARIQEEPGLSGDPVWMEP